LILKRAILRLQIRLAHRVGGVCHGRVYIDAHTGMTFRQKLGVMLAGRGKRTPECAAPHYYPCTPNE